MGKSDIMIKISDILLVQTIKNSMKDFYESDMNSLDLSKFIRNEEDNDIITKIENKINDKSKNIIERLLDLYFSFNNSQEIATFTLYKKNKNIYISFSTIYGFFKISANEFIKQIPYDYTLSHNEIYDEKFNFKFLTSTCIYELFENYGKNFIFKDIDNKNFEKNDAIYTIEYGFFLNHNNLELTKKYKEIDDLLFSNEENENIIKQIKKYENIIKHK